MVLFGKCLQRLTLCTDADVVKMDVINALDSSISQPKRRGVRKPAASKETKLPGEEKKIVEKSTTNTPAKSHSPKKSTISTPAPVTPPADPQQEESSNSVKGQPAAEQNSNGVSLSEEWSEGATPEPKKKKKKKKEANKDTEEEMKKGSETIEQVSCEKPFEVTKKANGDEKLSENTEHQTMIVQRDEVSNSDVVEEKREKKAKKKKKREKSEQGESQGSSEQISELASEGTDEILPAKTKKKKSKSNVENCEATHEEGNIIPEETPDENSSVVEKESNTNKSDFQDLSEQIFKKKKRKKDKADRGEATPEQADKDKSESVDINGKIHNESNVQNDPATLLPLSTMTPQTEKKKSEYTK